MARGFVVKLMTTSIDVGSAACYKGRGGAIGHAVPPFANRRRSDHDDRSADATEIGLGAQKATAVALPIRLSIYCAYPWYRRCPNRLTVDEGEALLIVPDPDARLSELRFSKPAPGHELRDASAARFAAVASGATIGGCGSGSFLPGPS